MKPNMICVNLLLITCCDCQHSGPYDNGTVTADTVMNTIDISTH